MSQLMSGKQIMNTECFCVADIWILTVLNHLSYLCGLLFVSSAEKNVK